MNWKLPRFVANSTRRTRFTQAQRARQLRLASTVESLEDRRLLAYTFTGGGTAIGTATGDGAADTLFIEEFGGLIYHSTDGTVFSPDWGGGNTIAASTANTINVDQSFTANAHAVNLGGVLAGESALNAQININQGGANSSLTVDDSLDTQLASGATAYTYNGTSTATLSGPPTMNVHLTGLPLPGGVTLIGGTQGNVFNVNSTDPGEPLTIVGGPSNDDIFVKGNSSTVTVQGGGGTNQVFVGSGGSVASINGPVIVTDPGGASDLTVDASNDTAGTTATDKLNTSTGLADIIGMTPGGNPISYLPSAIFGLSIQNNTGAQNTFTFDFSNGNVLADTSVFSQTSYNGGATGNPLADDGELDLIGTLPSGAWTNEKDQVTGETAGIITLDGNVLNYTGVPTHSVNDVTPAVNYTFLDSSTPGIVDMNTGPVFGGFQTLQIRSLDPTAAFPDTNVANKTNVTVTMPLSPIPTASFASFLDYPGATAPTGLATLTINQANAGDTKIIQTPPGIPVTYNQTDGAFTTEVTGPGLSAGTTTTVNGPAGNGTLLTYDAGEAHIDSTNVNTFFSPGQSNTQIQVNTTLFGASIGAGDLVYSNYLNVTINNIAPVAPVVSGQTIAAVEGAALNNVLIGTFTSTAIGAKASDFQATIDWNDGSVTTGTILQDAVDPTVFGIYGSHTYAATGTFTPTLTVSTTGSTGLLSINGIQTTFNTDPTVVPSTGTATVTVTDAGLIATANSLTGVEGTPTAAGTILATFTDTGGANPTTNYSVTINWGDGTGNHVLPNSDITQNGTSNTYSVAVPAHDYHEAGTFAITLSISDLSTPAQTVTVTGNAFITDAALTAAASADLAGTEGASLTGQVASFTDANPTAPVSDFTATIFWGDGTSSVGVVSQPGGVGTAFVVTGTHTYTEDTTVTGPYAIQTIITDDDGATTNTGGAPTLANIADAPLIALPGLTLGGVEGQPLVNVPVAVFTDTNPFGSVGDFSATIDWGDGTTTDGVIQEIGGSAAGVTFEVLGTHTFTDVATDPITVTITDKGGAPPITIVSTAIITQAPISITAFPVVGIEGNALAPTPTADNPGGLVLVGTFHDFDGGDPISDYSVIVNWGDGTADDTLGLVQVVAEGAGTFEVYAPAHVYQEEGNYAVTISVTDADPITVNAVGIAVISDAALTAVQSPPITATEGLPLNNVLVATFNDADPLADPGDFTAIIYWGDGSSTTGVVTETGAPGTPFVVHGSHTYAEETAAGIPYQIGVVITDQGGASTNTTSIPTLVTVNDAALTSSGIPVAAIEGTAFSGVPVATFTDANPGATVSDFTATITWGDGGTSQGVIVPVAGNAQGAVFQVLGGHTYNQQGSFPLSVVITDVGGSTTTTGQTGSVVATVADATLVSAGATITGVEGNSTGSVLVATFTDANPLATAGDPTDFSAIVNWGDGTSSSGANVTITGIGTPNGVTYQVFATHTYSEEGTYQVTTTINDLGGSATIAHGQAVVADAPITVTGIAPVTAIEGQSFTAQVASISDGNPQAHASDFTATIFWGDGTSTLGTISGVGPFIVSGTHTYADETLSTPDAVRVFVTDKGGSQGRSFLRRPRW